MSYQNLYTIPIKHCVVGVSVFDEGGVKQAIPTKYNDCGAADLEAVTCLPTPVVDA